MRKIVIVFLEISSCFTSFQEGFSIAMPKCNIVKCQQNSEKNPMKLPLKSSSFALHVALCRPVLCRESQGLSAPAVLESGSCLFLLLGKTSKIVSVGIKELLCLIRRKSSRAVVHNGEQKTYKQPDKLFMVASLPPLLAITAAASSDVLCFILTRR